MTATSDILEEVRALCLRRLKADRGGNFFVAAIGVWPNGRVVRAWNVEVPGLRVPEGHAERRLRRLVHGSEVFVARVRRDGLFGLARPCGECELVLRQRGVMRVSYSIAEGEYGVLEWW